MWLVFALTAPFLFAAVHVMDSYCVDEIFEKPWMGVVTSAVASLIIYIPLPFILPFLSWKWPPLAIIMGALTAGALIQLSQALYFQSLKHCEVGIVASYWNMIPVVLPLLSFFLLGETLMFSNYLGIATLVLASTLMFYLDHNLEMRITSFSMMGIASLMQAFSYLIQKWVYREVPFLCGYIFIITGLIIVGLLPLLIPKILKLFRRNIGKLILRRHTFILIEIINLMALSSAEIAIMLGIPSLVAAAETTMPAFTLALSLGIPTLTRQHRSVKKKLPRKLLAVGLMMIGVWLIS